MKKMKEIIAISLMALPHFLIWTYLIFPIISTNELKVYLFLYIPSAFYIIIKIIYAKCFLVKYKENYRVFCRSFIFSILFSILFSVFIVFILNLSNDPLEDIGFISCIIFSAIFLATSCIWNFFIAIIDTVIVKWMQKIQNLP